MGRVVVTEFITIDGVVQAPGDRREMSSSTRSSQRITSAIQGERQ